MLIEILGWSKMDWTDGLLRSALNESFVQFVYQVYLEEIWEREKFFLGGGVGRLIRNFKKRMERGINE